MRVKTSVNVDFTEKNRMYTGRHIYISNDSSETIFKKKRKQNREIKHLQLVVV